jgi:molybdate transport system ATP-binding protein
MNHASGIEVAASARIGPLALELELTVHGTCVLVGPNGAGKSSALRMLLGVVRPDRGRIAVAGRVLYDGASRIDVALEERRLGYVPQDYALFPHLNVRDNVAFARPSAPGEAACRAHAERIAQLLAALQLEALADRDVTQLSGGEKQRVALARALSVEPHALLLDEPLAALDVHARAEVRAFLSEYLRTLSIPSLVVSHDAADARALGTQIAVLETGRIVQRGSWSELRARPASAFVAQFVAGPEAQS